MFKHFRGPLLAATVGVAVLASNPAAAATISAADCETQAGTVSVRAVDIDSAKTMTLYQTLDGTFQGQDTLEVYCRARNGTNLGYIDGAQIRISINPTVPGVTASMFQISALNGVPVTNVNDATPGNPVYIGPFPGVATFVITSPSNLLAPGIASEEVAVDFQVVTLAWGSTLLDPISSRFLSPSSVGHVLAQTPELDSLALFGSGAMGLLGYGLTRLRAMRRRDK